MREITLILIHCSATPETMDIGAKEIRDWHVNTNGWQDIGYHYVIRRDGRQELGRPESEPGSHAAGHNANSIGVCMVGGTDANDKAKAECNFTRQQWASLDRLVTNLKQRHPNAEVLGHRDMPRVSKACPTFDAKAWWNA
jgi:N-acetylmuramoyl-L-alanine amidase